MLMNNVQAVNDALMFEMEKDPSVMVLGEDVGHEGGVFRATTGLQKKYGKERVVDTPLSENGIVGSSVGLALNGMKPVAEIQFSGFVLAAYDQLMSHASRLRQRSMGRFHVPMVVRMPFGGGVKALEHHSESDETIFIQIPGLKVVAPVDAGGHERAADLGYQGPGPGHISRAYPAVPGLQGRSGFGRAYGPHRKGTDRASRERPDDHCMGSYGKRIAGSRKTAKDRRHRA